MAQTPTAAELEIVERMINDGATATDIAHVLKRTRNSVMGIIFRYMRPRGIALRKRTVEFVAERARAANLIRTRERMALRERLFAAQGGTGKLRFGRLMKPMTKRLMELRTGECRFPVAEVEGATGRYLFCAKPVLADKVYCREHWNLCNASVVRSVARSRTRKPRIEAAG